MQNKLYSKRFNYPKLKIVSKQFILGVVCLACTISCKNNITGSPIKSDDIVTLYPSTPNLEKVKGCFAKLFDLSG